MIEQARPSRYQNPLLAREIRAVGMGQMGRRESGMDQELSFDRGALELAEIESINAELWAELAFDESAHAALRRDGLAPERLRLSGPNPFRFDAAGEARVVVSAGERADAEALLDLWRVHFLRRIAERATAQGS